VASCAHACSLPVHRSKSSETPTTAAALLSSTPRTEASRKPWMRAARRPQQLPPAQQRGWRVRQVGHERGGCYHVEGGGLVEGGGVLRGSAHQPDRGQASRSLWHAPRPAWPETGPRRSRLRHSGRRAARPGTAVPQALASLRRGCVDERACDARVPAARGAGLVACGALVPEGRHGGCSSDRLTRAQ
jgi:hypothetical protein